MNNLKNIRHKTLNLSYLVNGTGPIGIICFHGFGRNAKDFTSLNLNFKVKIISINLPFHSESKYEETDSAKTFLKEDLIFCVSEIIKKEKVDEYYIAGYSLGGKAVLSLLESNKLQSKGAILFAPDGFKSNPWYWFASQTKIGELLNRTSIKNLWLFEGFLKLSKTLGFASERQLKFAQQQMNSVSKRELVYNIWRSHRKLNANLNLVKSKLQQENIPLIIVLGKFDKIIPSNSIKAWSAKSSETSLIETCHGHKIPQEIIEKYLLELIQ